MQFTTQVPLITRESITKSYRTRFGAANVARKYLSPKLRNSKLPRLAWYFYAVNLERKPDCMQFNEKRIII